MSDHSHRRDFVRTLALGASAGLAADRAGAAAEEPETPRTEADARMELVLARFGAQLDDGARAVVRAKVEGLTRLAADLRRFPLDNGDGPAPVFRPARVPERR